MNLEEKDLQYIWHPCSQMKDYEELPPIVIDHAKGSYLYDIHGQRYLDIVSSWWCNLLGHCHERVNRAVKQQIDELEHVIFVNFSHRPAIALCEELASIVPKGLCKFSFTDNGSSSVEVAMKMSFQYHLQAGNPQKKRFMALSNAYHGETVGALSVNGVDAFSAIFRPMLMDSVIHVDGPDCYRCKYGQCRGSCQAECFEAAEHCLEMYGEETAAFLIEPMVQGAAGMRIYSPVYLKKLREACDRHQVLLIADEIAVGFGRTGKMFACAHGDISPDLMCISKGLTGGYLPMAIVASTQKIYDAFYADYSEGKAFMHSHTYSGNPLACAAALEVIRTLREERILEYTQANACAFTQLVRERIGEHKNVGEIRSIGLINAVELVADRKTKAPLPPENRTGYQIYKRALQKGVLLRPIGDVLYFNPPLTIIKEEMQEAIDVCWTCMKEILGE